MYAWACVTKALQRGQVRGRVVFWLPHLLLPGHKKAALLFVGSLTSLLTRRYVCRGGYVTEYHEVSVHFSVSII